MLPGATVVDASMVNDASAPSRATIPAGSPVIVRTPNNAFSTSGHVNVIVGLHQGGPRRSS